jgi:hypothetical protein
MPGEYKKPQSFCVMLRPKDAKQAERIFTALGEDGTVQIAIGEISGRCGSARSLIDSRCRG